MYLVYSVAFIESKQSADRVEPPADARRSSDRSGPAAGSAQGPSPTSRAGGRVSPGPEPNKQTAARARPLDKQCQDQSPCTPRLPQAVSSHGPAETRNEAWPQPGIIVSKQAAQAASTNKHATVATVHSSVLETSAQSRESSSSQQVG